MRCTLADWAQTTYRLSQRRAARLIPVRIGTLRYQSVRDHQDALRQLTESTSGLTGFLLQLGPFGGAYVHGWTVRVWALAFLCLVGAAALTAFQSRDL